MKKILILVLVSLLFILLLGFSPWLTKGFVQLRIESAFQAKWFGTADGCSLQRIEDIHRVPFGFKATIKYACGMKDFEGSKQIYISPISTVHNLP